MAAAGRGASVAPPPPIFRIDLLGLTSMPPRDRTLQDCTTFSFAIGLNSSAHPGKSRSKLEERTSRVISEFGLSLQKLNWIWNFTHQPKRLSRWGISPTDRSLLEARCGAFTHEPLWRFVEACGCSWRLEAGGGTTTQNFEFAHQKFLGKLLKPFAFD